MDKKNRDITRGYDKNKSPRDFQPGANKTKDKPPSIDKTFVLPPPPPKPKKS